MCDYIGLTFKAYNLVAKLIFALRKLDINNIDKFFIKYIIIYLSNYMIAVASVSKNCPIIMG